MTHSLERKSLHPASCMACLRCRVPKQLTGAKLTHLSCAQLALLLDLNTLSLATAVIVSEPKALYICGCVGALAAGNLA